MKVNVMPACTWPASGFDVMPDVHLTGIRV
jgi:hypothetical protein